MENDLAGVRIDSSPHNNTIGGTAAGAGNTISHNLYAGIDLNSAGTRNLIEDDVIDANGSGQPQSGRGDGVSIINSATTSVIGCTIDSNRDWGTVVKNMHQFVQSGNTFSNKPLGDVDTIS